MKKMYRTLRMAIHALRRNVMRSVLTTLGIIIGVAAVIAMMEIGKGSSTAIRQTIASMGANNLLVQPGTASSGGVTFGSGSIVTLTPQDAEAILRECPAVRDMRGKGGVVVLCDLLGVVAVQEQQGQGRGPPTTHLLETI